MRSLATLCLAALALVAIADGVTVDTLPRKLGEFDFRFPAFMEIYKTEDTSKPLIEQYTLYVSTFNPGAFFQTDPVFYLRAPGYYLDDVANWNLTQLDDNAFWPNNPDLLPSSVVGYEGVIWTSGFLVPSKTEGKLQMYNMNHPNPTSTALNIAESDTKHWSYHRVIWKDMDADGDLDALAARFHNADQEQSCVWFENPGAAVSNWTQHQIIYDGPDVHFRNVQLVSGGVDMDCIFAGEFWNEKLTVYCIPQGAPGGWNDPANIVSRVIDDTVGQPFDVLVEDINLDGRLDFLATAYNHSRGNVYVYDIPDDLFNGDWVRHHVAQDFKPNFILGGQSMSPGTPKTFYPTKEYADEVLPDGRHHKHWIVLSGDDDGKVYILRPNSDDPEDWLYEKTILVDSEATTSGKMAVADLNGDGYYEIIAAGYSAGKIYVFTYAP